MGDVIAQQVAPGIYAVSGNGSFAAPEGLRGLINTGARDCTVSVYPASEVIPCPCMVHAHRGGAHVPDLPFEELMVEADRNPPETPIRFTPPGIPLVVWVRDFVSGTAVLAPPVPPPTLTRPSNPYGVDTGAPATPMPVAPPRAAGLIPGFIISCETCGSRHISADSGPKGTIFECEDCGNLRRVRW